MKQLSEYQQEMQTHTAAYEALPFIRRFYPWRLNRPSPKPVAQPVFREEKLA